MTRSASRGTSSKALTIRASRRPAVAALGDGGPHALVELAAELLDERSSSSATSTSPFGDEHLAVPGLHAQEPHGERRLWQSAGAVATRSSAAATADAPRPPRGGAPARAQRRRAEPEHVDRPGAGPEAAQAVADGLRRDALGLARARPRGRRPAPAARPASRSACSPSRARRRRGGARPASSTTRSPSKTTSIASSRCPPVTTTAPGPERVDRPRELLARRASSSPASTRASGRFGVTTVARATTSSTSAAWASSSSSRAPDSATITGSTTIGVPGGSRSKRLRHRPRARPRCRASRS